MDSLPSGVPTKPVEAICLLLELYKRRPDLQSAFPEVPSGEYSRIIAWAANAANGVFEDSSASLLVAHRDWYTAHARFTELQCRPEEIATRDVWTRSKTRRRGAKVIAGGIDQPCRLIETSYFSVTGWIRAAAPVQAVNVLANGRECSLSWYDRPDVRREYPRDYTKGFTTFVRLARLMPCADVRVQVICEGEEVLARGVQVASSAVERAMSEEEARMEKLQWIVPRIQCIACQGELDQRGRCCSCGYSHQRGEFLDCLPPDYKGLREIEFNGAVCSHGYDADVERLIAQAEASGGKVLDCGAGLRPAIRRSVVTTEIFPYPTTDVLAVNQKLPFKDEVFDVVLSLHVLEHVPDPFACARELYRVLKPNGTLFAATPMIVPEHGFPHHFFNPTREGLLRLFGASAEKARVFVPAMGHPINGIWSVLGLYRDCLPEPERSKFLSMTVADIMAQPIEQWIRQDIARALSEEGRARLAANWCIEIVKQ